MERPLGSIGIELAKSVERAEQRVVPQYIVGLRVRDKYERMLCQRRSWQLKHHPGAWTLSAGGHKRLGETDKETLHRETLDELGVAPMSAQKSIHLHLPPYLQGQSPRRLQLYDTQVEDASDFPVTCNPDEVDEVGWFTSDELLLMQAQGERLQPEFAQILSTFREIKQAPVIPIFDMDGVLIDSTERVHRSIERILAEDYGFLMPLDDHGRDHGYGLDGRIARWRREYGLDIPSVEVFLARLMEKELQEGPIQPHTGVIPLLAELQARCIPAAVGSASPFHRTEQFLTLAGIRQHFLSVVSRDCAPQSKPHPDIFLEAARQLDVDPSCCVVIEDAPKGAEAAKAAGMRVVGITNKLNNAADFVHADNTASSCAELTVDQLIALVNRR